MSDILHNIAEAKAYIQSKTTIRPTIAVVLGSGLGGFAGDITNKIEIPYNTIPHFAISTVQGHSGSLILGTMKGKQVVCMAGRFHYYEGYSTEQVVFPIRVLKAIGVTHLLISNAAGGVMDGMKVGDLMLINDHISFATVNPLIGSNIDSLGSRFPDMSAPYSKAMNTKLKAIAAQNHIAIKEGVYFGVTGPTFETRAEYALIKILGGHAVGMSTVQEVIVAVHSSMQVAAISIICDLGIRDEDNTITHQEVLDAAAEAAPKLALLYTQLIATL